MPLCMIKVINMLGVSSRGSTITCSRLHKQRTESTEDGSFGNVGLTQPVTKGIRTTGVKDITNTKTKTNRVSGNSF